MADGGANGARAAANRGLTACYEAARHRRSAGMVKRYHASFPSLSYGFNSRYPLQNCADIWYFRIECVCALAKKLVAKLQTLNQSIDLRRCVIHREAGAAGGIDR